MNPPLTARHCIFCHGQLPRNEAVEHFPVGERVAFDPGRGRLWAVCGSCGRWNLAPFEERWEALEELEKAGRDQGRVLASTEHIALIRVPGIDVVRVGSAKLAEEAWWRYGTRMMKRRRTHRLISYAEGAAVVGVSLLSGGFYWFVGGDFINNFLRWRKFGKSAWRGGVECDTCGAPLTEIRFRSAANVWITQDEQGQPAVSLRCWRCRVRVFGTDSPGEHRIEGLPAQHVLRRVLAYTHYSGASEQLVRSATDYIDQAGSPDAVLTEVTRRRRRLRELSHKRHESEAVALDIALNDQNERRLLEMELAELEARWRQEEEIAAIVDGELTPMRGLEGLRGESAQGG